MFYVLIFTFVFILGLLFGSFLNVVADRVINGESIIKGRSHCDSCKKTLVARDLIPIISIVIAKFKCRYCGTNLSLYYPFSELLTGVAFVVIFGYSNILAQPSIYSFLSFVYLLLIACFYIVLFLTDIKYRLIPNSIVIIGVITVVLYTLALLSIQYISIYSNLANDNFGQYLLRTDYFKDAVLIALRGLGVTTLSSIGIALFFILLILITRGRGMGAGDATLGFLIGFVNGFPNNILAIFLGFALGSLVSIGLIIARTKTVKDTVPFGPFLITGSVISYFWGTQLLDIYYGLFR